MTVGIYCYKDLQNNNSIVYIGKDASIDINKRHKDHFYPSKYDEQVINRVLQNNPDRYSYEVLKEWNMEEHHPKTASLLEKLYIRRYNPKFNFTKGGDGCCGFSLPESTKQKMSESMKKLHEEGHVFMHGKHHSEESKKKISNSLKGRVGKDACGWKDYPRIVKNGLRNGRQRYAIKYNGKIIKESIFLDNLEKELYLLINEVN